MKRRHNGEGTYGKKTINGYKYFSYTAPNGAWRVYAKTLGELEEKRKAKEEESAVVESTPASMTVADLCFKWLSTIIRKVSPSTYDAYEDIIKVRIKEYKPYRIGSKPTDSLTVAMLNSYLQSMKEEYSKASIDKTWIVLKQSLEYGQEHNYVPAELNLKRVERPTEREVSVKKKEVQFTTLEDMEILYEEANKLTSRNSLVYGNGAKVLIFIMYSGLRIGEAIGLKWKHVSKDYSEIYVQQSNRRVVQRDEDGNAIMNDKQRAYIEFQKETKTRSGERVVPLPDRAIEIIRYFDSAFPDHTLEDHVFLTQAGKIFDRRNLERTLQRIMNNSECSNKNYTPHSLRHGYGSILLSQGVDIKTVSVLLGHKDISTTYNIYIHVMDKDKKKAITSVFNSKPT